MLVLTGSLNESIIIDAKVRLEPGQVRIGIDVPEDVLVLREEVVGVDDAKRLIAAQWTPPSPH